MTYRSFLFVSTMAFAAAAHADIHHNYENLSEGFLGSTFSADGVTYRDVNNVSGSQPGGEPFGPGDLGDQLIIEDATLFFNDFPTFGSADKVLTFGSAFINGDNLSIGALASVFMDLDELGQAADFDIAFYENGPWGNIEYHLDALLGGQVVATDSYTLANGGGRDNVNLINMAVSGAEFD